MAQYAVIAGGGALRTLGALHASRSAAAAHNFNAQVGRQNAALSRQQAAEDERVHRVGARKQLGSIRAGFGASGVRMEGTPTDVLGESASTAELDALKIRYGGELEAMAFEQQAKLDRMHGKSAKKAGNLAAANVLFDTGFRMASLRP